jgi:triacylglycerol lipase
MNIVLAQGILGFQTLLGVEYFNGVKSNIETKYPSVKVLETQVNPVEGVEVRGSQLGSQILDSLGDTGKPPSLNPGDKTHIIAYSMGGLDARYLLSPANPANLAGRVTSLTTISAPHRGSPVADLLMREANGEALTLLEKVATLGLHKSMTLLGVPLEGLHDLTTQWTADFNKHYGDSPKVLYFSIAGTGRSSVPPTSVPLLAPYLYIKDKVWGEPNDGMVAVGSSAWGDSAPDLWPADHADVIGHNLDNLPLGTPDHFDYLSKYDGIVNKLLAL